MNQYLMIFLFPRDIQFSITLLQLVFVVILTEIKKKDKPPRN